ncbi:Signal peptidase-like protein [Marivirga sp. S37H4]|uniref:Signal peptidase-like protein n=1 Tax=Marivirga aurantiaca TaxID=2802615 RepID=A0A934X1Z1_9BACT|nr:regulatory iron-sulfur-containing complex subunit RicT [Marivirga aurantiaca]MBK6267002.1 Signal peptidase-like protein [Marivirga aurantiaca]
MGCSSCGINKKEGVVSGCQNNGGCSTGGCNKMNAFDWLSNMDFPNYDTFDIAEIKFKGGRKEFFRNVHQLELNTGDPVVVDVPNGHHIGYVSLQGELVRLQMQRRKVKNDDEIKAIYRIASDKDLEKWHEVQNREMTTMYRAREVISEFKMNMKLSDVEYQADNTKATFYYSAEERVDFRELIKKLAGEFKIRVEMRQISLRQEAGRLGGIGSCGRELCCSTWLSDFKSVSTNAARYQNLSLNPSKLSGQCGRLKCCLNYELDTYIDALKGIPEVNKPIQTQIGNAKLQKTDIFRRIMWFSYSDDNIWHPVKVERVAEILTLNQKGEKPETLLEDVLEIEDHVNINSDLIRLDRKFSKPKAKKKSKSKNFKGKPKGNNNPQNNVAPKSETAKNPQQNTKSITENNPGNQSDKTIRPKNKPKNKKRFRKNNKPNNNNKTGE